MIARKGTLIVAEENSRTYSTVADTSHTARSYRLGVVSSATRGGGVRTWQDIATGDAPKPMRGAFWVVPAEVATVAKAAEIAKAHCWPGHPNQPKAFDSLEDIKAALRG